MFSHFLTRDNAQLEFQGFALYFNIHAAELILYPVNATTFYSADPWVVILMVFHVVSRWQPLLTQKRKSSEIPASKFKALSEKLKEEVSKEYFRSPTSTKLYFSIMLFILLWKMRSVLTFACVDKINVNCDHSNESYWAVLSYGVVYCAGHCGSTFWVRGWNPKVRPFKWKLLSSSFLWCCLLGRTRWF